MIGCTSRQPGCGARGHSLKAVLPLTSGRSTPVAQASACLRVETAEMAVMGMYDHDDWVQGGSTWVWCQLAQPEGCATADEREGAHQ
jgi:hypothetical protein